MRKSKISTRKRNFKSKRTRSLCLVTSDLSNGIKNMCKSCETIPLNNEKMQEIPKVGNPTNTPLFCRWEYGFAIKYVKSQQKYYKYSYENLSNNWKKNYCNIEKRKVLLNFCNCALFNFEECILAPFSG
jgi:hypothetical protein